MKKIVILFVAFAFVAAIGGQAGAESAYAAKRMPMSYVSVSCYSPTSQENCFVFRGGTDPLNGFNLSLWDSGCNCEQCAVMGALLGEEDDVLVGVGAAGMGYAFVVGFDETLFNCDGPDLVMHAVGPGTCIQHYPQYPAGPAKVYVSAHNIDDKTNMDYDYDKCNPKPWYYNDDNWTYVGTIMPSHPPCVGGGVVPTPIDFSNARVGDTVEYHSSGGMYLPSWWEDMDAYDPNPPDKVCWVKVKFGWPTTYDESDPPVPFYANTSGLYPDPEDLNIVWGDSIAQFVDAIEGLHVSPTGDINADGKVDSADNNILLDNLRRNVCN